MPSSLLFAINNEGRVFGLSTTGSKWREFVYLGLEFKHLSAVPHFMWAVGGDRQIYVHVHGLDIPIRIKEEAYENERWLPLEGFSGRLLPTDRYHYSSQDGTRDRGLDKIRLPSMAWQWEGEWHLETTLDGQPLDHDVSESYITFMLLLVYNDNFDSGGKNYESHCLGWTYAVDFPATYHPKKQWKSCVRRRKWIRYRRYSAMNSWCAIAPLHKDPTQVPSVLIVCFCSKKLNLQQLFSIDFVPSMVMFRTGVSTTAPEGLRWTSITVPPGCEVNQISVGPTGLVWAVLWNGRALVRAGVTRDSPTVVGLKLLFSEVFAIGSEDRCLYFRTGVLQSDLTGKKWRPIHAPTQLSRASSNASLWSANYRNSLSGGTPREKRVRSWTSLARNSCSGDAPSILRDWEETSRSAPTPTSLRLQPTLWQRSSDGASLALQRPSVSEESVSESSGAGQLEKSNEMINTTIQEHSEGAVTEIQPVFVLGKGNEMKKNPTVWSPIRSVGSMVGMEVHPESDGSAFDPASGDSGVFGEDEDADAMFWADVELFKPWRVKILQELKRRMPDNGSSFENYEKAVEMSSWVKTGKARCQLKESSQQFDDCMLELEWVGSDKGSLDSGTLSILSVDKKHTKMQFSLSEITCVICCSEPSKPRIAIHTPKLTKGSSPLKLQFSGDTDMEDWMANLTSVCCQMFGVNGPPSPGAIWITTGLGDVFVFDPAILEASQLRGEMYTQELDVAGKETPYEAHLHNGFPPGTILTVKGCVNDDCDRFSINLQCPSISQRHKNMTDILFHFNPRFPDEVIVRNSLICGDWGTEDREGDMVLKAGAEFTIDIECQEDAFKVIIDGNLFTYYEHKQKPHNVTHVAINGGVSLNKVVYQSKMVIVPPADMFWRQMGGHLRRVETCSAGVTWGIGYDNTAWVYTGGWGGSFLKGINSMIDTHSYYVYENQRWNPLTGYTAHGLPTDRYMWSDVTGKHKRTREKTKLLSMHWQWVNEDGIDTLVDVWAVAANGDVGTSWEHVPSDQSLASISCGGDKQVWAVGRNGSAYWSKLSFHAFSVYWNNLMEHNCMFMDILWYLNKTFIKYSTFPHFIVRSPVQGEIWAVTVTGVVCRRHGITPDNPAGTGWSHGIGVSIKKYHSFSHF
ncbi:Tectonin beta-propeller repeat-containing protein [Blattella germanica]|nr:Tectonin beta-propeller repeat-containing protein [Blattella germanica]